MATSTTNSAGRRNNPFVKDHSLSLSAPMSLRDRPKSMSFASSPSVSSPSGHSRNQSFSPLSGSNLAPPRTSRQRSNSNRSKIQVSNTFAPKFIETEELQRDTERVRSIEGENDFSGRRYVWVKDSSAAFVKGWVVEELERSQLLIQCDDGSVWSFMLDQVKVVTDYNIAARGRLREY